VYLVSNKTGLTETLNGDDLAGLLVNNGVQLAVFNSCRGAYTATSDSLESGKERNLAEALVKRGIPSVLAMAERIPDEVALTLTRLLYRNLNLGYPIDLSLSRARQGLIAAYGSNQLYWALPVLYLHPEFDGFLTNTDNSDHNREELFTLPDPPDLPLSELEEEAQFTSPANNRTFIDDELTSPFLGADADYGEDEFGSYLDGINPDDPDDEDPSAFIQNLLIQIDTKPVTSNPNAVNLEPPTPSFNSQLSANRESSASSPPSNEVTMVPTVNTNVNTNQPVNRDKSAGLNGGWQKFRLIPRLWQVVGATSVLAIALLGLWFWQNQGKPNLGQLGQNSSLPNLPSDNPPGDLTKADTSLVTNTAIEQFGKGNITEGQQAVEELLNRGALQQAKAALETVPGLQRDNNAAISFLWGRLTWQLVQTGNKDYDLTDARRYWETAKKKQPKSPTYLTALGFAFYGEGKYDDANNAWFEALYATESAQGTAASPGQALSKEVLTIYAGLALGLEKSAQEQSGDKQANLLNESRKLRQKVMKDAPAEFQPDALGKPENWLWTEQAIQDWRSLVANNK
ncbi:MAG TPA: CHAT domain-containing protein, partial [Cyanophyceae cyanobacterium]